MMKMQEKKELGSILKEGLNRRYGITNPVLVAQINTVYPGHRTPAAIIKTEKGAMYVVVCNPLKFGGFSLYHLNSAPKYSCKAVLLRTAKETIQQDQCRVEPLQRHLS